MASKSELEILKLRKLLKEVNDLRNQFGLVGMEINFEGLEDAEATTKELAAYAEKYKKAINEANDAAGDLNATIKANLAEHGKIATAQNQYLKGQNKSLKLSQQLYDDAMGITELQGKQVTTLAKTAKIELARRGALKEQLEAKQDISKEEEQILKRLQQEYNTQEAVSKAANKRLLQERKITKAMGLSGAAAKGIVGALGKMGIHSDFFEDMNSNMREAAKSGSKMKVAMSGIGSIFGGLKEAANDPLVMFGMLGKSISYLFKLAGKLNVKTRQVAQATGGMFSLDQMYAFKDAGGAMFDGAIKAATELREELGFIPNLTKEMIQSQHMLTQGFGLSSKEAAGLLKIGTDADVAYNDMSTTIARSTGEFEAQTGYATDTQAVMKELGNSSAALRFNMKGSSNELLKAANYSTLLGMSMDEIRGAAESTLSFESSIQKEMEAEMFLQKNLNLDKYRYAALTGDAATQASELQRLIAENGPALKGNVKAQEAFAASLGISREQLAGSLESMDLQQKLGFKSENAQKAYNDLLAKGMSKEEAIKTLKEQGAKGIEDSLKAELAHKNIMKKTIADLESSLLPLAQTVSELFKGISKAFEPVGKLLNKKIFGSFTVGSAIGAFAGGAMALKLIKGIFGGAKRTVAMMDVGYMKVAMGGPGGGGVGGGGGGGYHETGGGRNKSKSKGRYRDPKTGRYAKRPKGRSSRPRRRRGGRGRSLLGLAGGLLGYELMSNMFSDSETGETSVGGDMASMASMSAVDAGVSSMGSGGASSKASSASPKSKPRSKPRSRPRSKPKAGKSFLGSLWGGIKSIGSSVYSAGKGVYDMGASAISKVSDIGGSIKKWFGKKIGGLFPKLLKMAKGPIKGIAGKIPILGSILEMIFTGMDVNSIAQSKDMSKQEMYGEMGRSVISGGMGLLGGSLAAAGVSSLQAIGIPGWLLSGAAYMGGDYLGRMLGNAISDYVGGPSLGKGIFNLFYEGGANKKASTAGGNMEKSPKMMATGGIVTSATNAIVGEAGAEAVVPLNDFYAKLDELIAVVKQGGDVYMDGAKVGKSMAMSTSRLG